MANPPGWWVSCIRVGFASGLNLAKQIGEQTDVKNRL